jgi:hypothetical protein
LGFDFRVKYRSGTFNTVALSWRDTEEVAAVHVLSTPSFKLLDDLRTKVVVDPALVTLRQEV